MVFRFFKKNLILCLTVLSMLCNGDMVIKFQDVIVDYINGEYVDEDTFEFSVNYINETYNTLKLKAVVLKDFPRDLMVTFRAFAHVLGGFRIPMGFDMHFSTCDLKSKHMLMAPFILAIGGDLDKCIPDKGEYGNESFYPVNVSALPNIFPKNKYKYDIKIGNDDIDIIAFQVFLDVV